MLLVIWVYMFSIVSAESGNMFNDRTQSSYTNTVGKDVGSEGMSESAEANVLALCPLQVI